MTELEKLESRIETAITSGKNAMIAVVKLIGEVYEKKLWESKYKSFSQYCEKRWQFSRIRGYQIVGSADILKLLPEKALSALNSEKAVAALKNVPANERESVIEKAAQTGKVTSTAINRVAKENRQPKSDAPTDKTGFPIPDGILEDWNRAGEMAQYLMSRISQAKIAVEEGIEKEDVIFKELNSGATADLKNVYGAVKRIDPHAVCTVCNGHPKKCRMCHDKGFISKFLWDTVVTEEIKAKRK